MLLAGLKWDVIIQAWVARSRRNGMLEPARA